MQDAKKMLNLNGIDTPELDETIKRASQHVSAINKLMYP
jgi:hypothetical protein